MYMSGFSILTTEPTDIDFNVMYTQPISQTIFNSMFDDAITDKDVSDSFLNSLFVFMNTDIPLRRQLRSSVQTKDGNTTPYKITINDASPIKIAIHNTAEYNATTFAIISTNWVSGNYLQFVFTTTPVVSTIKFSILVQML
jgi:hypothetical protein